MICSSDWQSAAVAAADVAVAAAAADVAVAVAADAADGVAAVAAEESYCGPPYSAAR